MRAIGIKKILSFLLTLFCFLIFNGAIQGQDENHKLTYISLVIGKDKTLNNESASLAQQILIVDSPGKKGKEFKDTTIVVNSELKLYAALYNNGKYKSEARVDWFWADTSKIPDNPADTSVFLGFSSSIIFKPHQIGTGFIFVKNLPNAAGDSTGTIKIITLEKLAISPAYSAHATITQGQHNIFVSFQAKNIGDFSSIVQEANLQLTDVDSQIITQQYTVHRIDTTTIIPIAGTRQFEFLVDVHSDADTGLVFIDVQLMTGEAFYSNIEPRQRWQVQTPPLLNIDWIDALVEEVFPGQEAIFVAMYVSNRGGASVGDLNASLTFWRNGQDVSDQYESRMSETNPQIIKGDSSAQINLIVRAKPSAAYGTVVINGKISAQDVNTALWYSDTGADLPASWLVTQTLAQVGIISTRIDCPHRDASGNGEVNLRQRYAVEVVVRNQGNEAVHNIGVSISADGNSSFLTNRSRVIHSLVTFQADTVFYQLEAQGTTIPGVESFIAQIDSATSMGGAKAIINAAFDSLAQVKIVHPANLILKVSPALVNTPVRGTFDMTATVGHSAETASFDSTGTLAIRLPQDYQLIPENYVQPFQENGPVSWKIRSPAVSGGPDTILVFISQLPHDKNNPEQLAQVSIGSAWIIAHIKDIALDIADVAIIEPAGAIDQTVSTGQWLLVRAKVKSQLVQNIAAQIRLPENFALLDDAIKPLSADSVTWWLRAPQLQSDGAQPIVVQAWGNVENDTATVFSPPDASLSVITVSRANLQVAAQIIEPPSASQGQISPGLVFKIKGEILNTGDAGVIGNQSLLIDVPDNNSFRVIGDTLMSVENQPAIWTVQAAEKLDAIPKIIKVRIHDIPYDENSDEEAYISNEHQVADVPVFTSVINIQLMVRQLPEIAPKAIAPGITATMMGIEFVNLNPQTGFTIQINTLKFDIEDKAGQLIVPGSLIAGFRIRSEEAVIGEASSLLFNPIVISLTNPIHLDAGETSSVVIKIDCQENLSQSFQINLKDASYLEIDSPFPVSIIDESKNPVTVLNLRSHYPVMTETDLKCSFKNYPNPFGTPDRSKTHFIYYLSQDCDLELQIYTLIGELVWSRAFSSSSNQGKKGLHQEDDIVWDAKNSRGHKVLNGVYIARIKTSNGESAMTKVVVIK